MRLAERAQHSGQLLLAEACACLHRQRRLRRTEVAEDPWDAALAVGGSLDTALKI